MGKIVGLRKSPLMEFELANIINAPFRMQPGLSRMPPGAKHTRLLAANPALAAEKLQILQTDADRALLICPGFDATPAFSTAAQCVAAEWPAACRFDGSQLALLDLGLTVNTASLHAIASTTNPAWPQAQACILSLPAHQQAWAALSLLIQDDLAVLDGKTTVLKALAVCVPSHWAPEEKLGLPFAAVHAPVADNALLVNAAQSLSRLVTSAGPDRWQRFVWTLQPSPMHDGHPKRAPARDWPFEAKSLGERLWLRVEHQTFIVVPTAQQAVFTIRVMLEPLGVAIKSVEDAQNLHAAISSMSDTVIAYRSLQSVKPHLLQWLAHRSIER
jgi:dimethylamine monooxygenase subunit A